MRVLVQVCFLKYFLFIIYRCISVLRSRVAANSIKCVCASGWFIRMETTTGNILRTFEAEILKIVKNIQPSQKIRRFFKKTNK